MRERTQTTPTTGTPTTPLSGDARAALTAMADRLTRVRPGGTMSDPVRMAMALRHACETHGVCTTDADRLEAEILAHSPRVETDITRGEYALLLHRAANA